MRDVVAQAHAVIHTVALTARVAWDRCSRPMAPGAGHICRCC
jgi:hypothetical protein